LKPEQAILTLQPTDDINEIIDLLFGPAYLDMRFVLVGPCTIYINLITQTPTRLEGDFRCKVRLINEIDLEWQSKLSIPKYSIRNCKVEDLVLNFEDLISPDINIPNSLRDLEVQGMIFRIGVNSENHYCHQIVTRITSILPIANNFGTSDIEVQILYRGDRSIDSIILYRNNGLSGRYDFELQDWKLSVKIPALSFESCSHMFNQMVMESFEPVSHILKFQEICIDSKFDPQAFAMKAMFITSEICGGMEYVQRSPSDWKLELSAPSPQLERFCHALVELQVEFNQFRTHAVLTWPES
jgi:hypothetical protein